MARRTRTRETRTRNQKQEQQEQGLSRTFHRLINQENTFYRLGPKALCVSDSIIRVKNSRTFFVKWVYVINSLAMDEGYIFWVPSRA